MPSLEPDEPDAAAAPLGRFLELSVATADIRESFEFYQRLGFSDARTNDIVPHAYGVLAGGGLVLGLHAAALPEASLTFVRHDVARLAALLETRDIPLAPRRLGSESFNEIGFEDPAGNALRVLEARTFSPPTPSDPPRCGTLEAISLPALDDEASMEFWAALGFFGTIGSGEDWMLAELSLGALHLALHDQRTSGDPLLVFRSPDLDVTRAALEKLSVPAHGRLRRGPADDHILLTAPEGTRLLVL